MYSSDPKDIINGAIQSVKKLVIDEEEHIVYEFVNEANKEIEYISVEELSPAMLKKSKNSYSIEFAPPRSIFDNLVIPNGSKRRSQK